MIDKVSATWWSYIVVDFGSRVNLRTMGQGEPTPTFISNSGCGKYREL